MEVVCHCREYAHCTHLWEWCCGNKDELPTCFQLVSFPFLSWESSFLTVDHISQPSFLSAVLMTLSSTLSGTFPTHSFVASFSLFWSCKVNGFLGSSDTCVPQKFMPSSRSLSLASCHVCVEPLLMEPLPLYFWLPYTSIVSGSTCSNGSALAVTNTGSHCWLSVSAMLPVASAHTEWPTQCQQGNDSTDGQRQLKIMVTILRMDTHKDVPEVMSLCMAYIYRSARIILELRLGCGYDIGAYRKSQMT